MCVFPIVDRHTYTHANFLWKHAIHFDTFFSSPLSSDKLFHNRFLIHSTHSFFSKGLERQRTYDRQVFDGGISNCYYHVFMRIVQKWKVTKTNHPKYRMDSPKPTTKMSMPCACDQMRHVFNHSQNQIINQCGTRKRIVGLIRYGKYAFCLNTINRSTEWNRMWQSAHTRTLTPHTVVRGKRSARARDDESGNPQAIKIYMNYVIIASIESHSTLLCVVVVVGPLFFGQTICDIKLVWFFFSLFFHLNWIGFQWWNLCF